MGEHVVLVVHDRQRMHELQPHVHQATSKHDILVSWQITHEFSQSLVNNHDLVRLLVVGYWPAKDREMAVMANLVGAGIEGVIEQHIALDDPVFHLNIEPEVWLALQGRMSKMNALPQRNQMVDALIAEAASRHEAGRPHHLLAGTKKKAAAS